MEIVTEEFYRVIPHNRKVSAQGWYNFNCPACGDKRGRGGFLITPTGGFRIKCFNGGCEYNSRTTGWEPDSVFGGRARKYFELCNGDIKSIPVDALFNKKEHVYNAKGEIKETKEVQVVHKFPEVELPPQTDILTMAAKKNSNAKKVLNYLKSRGEFLLDKHEFLWSKKHPYHLIIPYIHYNKIVGYLGRNIGNGHQRFIQKSAADYIFNQHIVNKYQSRFLIVVESPLDAIALNCLGVRNSQLTKKQINFLNHTGKEIVLLPDQKAQEWRGFLSTAIENKWYMATPEWGTGVKDVGESVQKNGLLYTVKMVMESITNNYDKAEIILNMRTTK